jgi:hypothetical protein
MLSTHFVLTNEGRIPLKNVRYTCQVDTIATSLGQLIRNVRLGERLLDNSLAPGEPLSLSCAIPGRTGNVIGTVGRQQVVRLTIEIRYQPLGAPIEGTYVVGFRTALAPDSTLRWTYHEAIPIWRPRW